MKNTFEEVLNRLEPKITAEPEPGCELEYQVVKAAISSLRNDKAPGPDLITAKMLKADIDLGCIDQTFTLRTVKQCTKC